MGNQATPASPEGDQAASYLAAIVTSSDDAIFSTDTDGTITAWNAAAEALCGYSAEETIGRDVALLAPPGREGEAQELIARVLRGDRVLGFQTQRRRKDGGLVDVEITMSPIRDTSGSVVAVSVIARDVSERRLAERELRQSEEKFAAAFNASPDLMAITRLTDGTILEVNEAYTRALGYSRAESLGKSTSELSIWAVPADRAAFVAGLEERGQIDEFETTLRRKDGSLLTCIDSARIIDFGGETCVLSVVHDITERTRAEAALRESEAQLRTLIDTLPDLVWLKDPEGVYLSCNRRFESFFGAAEKDIIGKTDYDFMGAKLADFFRQRDKAALDAGGPTANEEEIVFAEDGHREVLETIKTPIHASDGRLTGVLGVGRDITERRKAEVQLRAASLYARSLIEASLDPLVTISPEGKITDVNEATAEATGVARDQLIGTDFAEYFTEPRHARDGYKRAFEEGFVRDYPLALRSVSGDVTDVVYNATVYRGEAGEVEGVFAAARDVSERSRAEGALRESEARFRSLFEDSPIAIWEEDHSAVKARLEQLLAGGVEGIATYLRSHPDEYRRCIQLARSIDVNHAAVTLFAAADKQELLKRADELHRLETPGHLCLFWEALMAGERLASYEEANVTLAGESIELFETCTLAPGCEESWSRVYIVDADITERRRGEEALGRTNRELRTISICNETLLRATDEQSLLDDICRIVCDETGHRMAWVGYVEGDEAYAVRRAAWAGVDMGPLVAADASWDEVYTEGGLVAAAIRGGESVCIADLATDPRAAPWRESALQAGYRSSIVLPLNDARAATFGALTIYSIEPDAFTRDEVRLLEELAGDLAFGIGIMRARTELERAEEQREAHVALLEDMERIDQAIRRETDVERMLQGVVETLFSLFGCDRVWLFYPCDPDAPSFRVPVEVSRPEYPGANVLGQEVPMDPSVANDLRAALESDSPLTYANGTDRPVNTLTAEQFGVQAQMLQALYPRVGKPWVFGMHQCSHARIWTEAEVERFKEIGRRITDGLSTLLFLRDLQASEKLVSTAAAQWRETFDAMRDSVALFDAEGRVLRCNAATRALTGREFEEIIGRPCHEVFHDAEEWHPACPQVRARQSLQAETAIFEQEGRWLRVTFQPMTDAAGMPAGGVHVVSDITALKEAEQQSQRNLTQLQAVTDQVIAAIADIVEARDPYTAGHERRTAELAVAIATRMGLPGEGVTGVRVAALLHDVGKITVPTEILSKPGRLSELEFQLIREHPRASHDVLVGIDFPWPVAEVALHHHERLDGSGYPQGLAGDEIMLEARILAVADVVEAMASHRPYRPALGMEAAMAEIREHAGVKYDAGVVAVCAWLVEEQGFQFTP